MAGFHSDPQGLFPSTSESTISSLSPGESSTHLSNHEPEIETQIDTALSIMVPAKPKPKPTLTIRLEPLSSSSSDQDQDRDQDQQRGRMPKLDLKTPTLTLTPAHSRHASRALNPQAQEYRPSGLLPPTPNSSHGNSGSQVYRGENPVLDERAFRRLDFGSSGGGLWSGERGNGEDWGEDAMGMLRGERVERVVRELDAVVSPFQYQHHNHDQHQHQPRFQTRAQSRGPESAIEHHTPAKHSPPFSLQSLPTHPRTSNRNSNNHNTIASKPPFLTWKQHLQTLTHRRSIIALLRWTAAHAPASDWTFNLHDTRYVPRRDKDWRALLSEMTGEAVDKMRLDGKWLRGQPQWVRASAADEVLRVGRWGTLVE